MKFGFRKSEIHKSEIGCKVMRVGSLGRKENQNYEISHIDRQVRILEYISRSKTHYFILECVEHKEI